MTESVIDSFTNNLYYEYTQDFDPIYGNLTKIPIIETSITSSTSISSFSVSSPTPSLVSSNIATTTTISNETTSTRDLLNHSSLKLIQDITINFQLQSIYSENEIINQINISEEHINSTTSTPNSQKTLSWQRTSAIVFFSTLIIVTIIGNTLIILSVITTRRLRTVTNCFVMSLAVADWTVGIFVMPPAALLYVHGSWTVGWILCDIWISLDILLCTASILSLCAISLDRYLAVTQPLHYKKRRTKRLALFMIFIVWIVALAITCPPFLGWYEAGRRNSNIVECRYNQNKGYVIFSAMGSFFIPMIVMLYVYARICCVLTLRHNRMTKTEASERTTHDEIEIDNMTSEYDSCCHSPRRSVSMKRNGNSCIRNISVNDINGSIGVCNAGGSGCNNGDLGGGSGGGGGCTSGASSIGFERNESQHSLYELVEISKSSSTIRSSTITTCKYATNNYHHFKQPIQSVHFCQSQTSISESCLSSCKLRVNRNGKRVPMRISKLKRETKAAQTLSIVVGGFIACWLPFFVYYLLIPFLPKESFSLTLQIALTWLGWCNSAINPFIYAFYNTDFRIAFWRLTFRKLCKSQNNLALLKT